MKKLLLLVSLIVSSFILVACKAPDLVVYMPGAYIDEDLLKEFKEQTGKVVRITTFDDNETALMQANDISNRYDIIIPSDYAIEELAKKDLLEKIDWNRLTNFNQSMLVSELKEILAGLKTEGFDFLEYSVPYFWGSVGFLYNQNKISEEEVKAKEWKIFNEANYSSVIYDSSRDAFLMAIRQNGVFLNSASKAQIDEAEAWLISVSNRNNVVFLGDQILDAPANLTQDLIQVYSGDAIYIMESNDNYAFYKPTYTNIWADGFIIPKNAKDKDLAYEFIDFMLSYDSALANTLSVGYTTPVQSVFDYVLSNQGDFSDYEDTYRVVIDLENDEFFRYNEELKNLLDIAWRRVRTN